MKTDELTFEKDYIWLTQNNGISMYEDTLAVLSVKNQTIHFLHIDSLGKLVKIRSIGEFIYEDDEYTLSLHVMEGETDGRQAPPAAVGAPSTTARHGPEAGGGRHWIDLSDARYVPAGAHLGQRRLETPLSKRWPFSGTGHRSRVPSTCGISIR